MGDTPDLSGKIALVTGASRGIGAAVALGMAKAGAHVILLARTVGALEEVDDQIKAVGGSATILPVDLSKLRNADKVGPTLAERFGVLDIFVGNAANLGPLSPVHHIRPKEWQQVMELNFLANVHLVRSLDPLLRKAEVGRVVFTTSMMAREPEAYWGPYSASKAALDAFMKTYAAEVLQTNLKVNAIHPGPVDTAMMDAAFPGGADFPVKQPEDVVEHYLALCAPACDKHGEIVIL